MNSKPGLERSGNGNAGYSRPVAVLIVDDSDVARESLGNFIACQPGLRVAAVVGSGPEALRELSRVPVDLVLADLNMPGMDGLELARRSKALPTCPRVIVISAQNTPACRSAALEVGADGFVAKPEMGTCFMPLMAQVFGRSFPERSAWFFPSCGSLIEKESVLIPFWFSPISSAEVTAAGCREWAAFAARIGAWPVKRGGMRNHCWSGVAFPFPKMNDKSNTAEAFGDWNWQPSASPTCRSGSQRDWRHDLPGFGT
jgi:CheY-like chemotaxis protein